MWASVMYQTRLAYSLDIFHNRNSKHLQTYHGLVDLKRPVWADPLKVAAVFSGSKCVFSNPAISLLCLPD